MFFLCYSLTRHENPLEIFPYGDPPSPLENPNPSVGGGGGYGYFLEPHNTNLVPGVNTMYMPLHQVFKGFSLFPQEFREVFQRQAKIRLRNVLRLACTNLAVLCL